MSTVDRISAVFLSGITPKMPKDASSPFSVASFFEKGQNYFLSGSPVLLGLVHAMEACRCDIFHIYVVREEHGRIFKLSYRF